MGVRDNSIPAVTIFDKSDDGLVIFGTVKGAPPTTTLKFAKGCTLIDTDQAVMYVNNGDSVTPTWVTNGKVGTVVVDTNGTTAVAVWANGAPTALTIKSVFLISLDTTAGNITVENPASTVVCTIAKGATAGALVGGTTLSNTAVVAGEAVVVDSSSAGNARVHIVYEIA